MNTFEACQKAETYNEHIPKGTMHMKHDSRVPFAEIYANAEEMMRCVKEIQSYKVISTTLPDTANHLRFLRFQGFPETNTEGAFLEHRPEIKLELTEPSTYPFTS